MIGRSIGPYQILAKLGEGGMGQVYRARDTKLDRDVALKVLPEGFASDADRLMRFTREAKTLASINHPHIAQVYDAGREGTTAFIVMEFVDGEDLADRIRRGAIPLAEALPIARQIADALVAAHDAGIVHRDLKPANVKVREDGTVKVLDFGLAKNTAGDSSSSGTIAATMTSPAMTAMGLILGTASYMSPEQAKGRPVDRRADVWAFGVVLYEMLTGAFLFGREDVTDTLAAVLTAEPDLGKLPAETPVEIRRLLARCLLKDKRARLDSMTTARLEIDDATSAGARPGPPGSSMTRSWILRAAAAGVVMFAVGWIAATYGTGGITRSSSAAQPVFSYIAAPEGAHSAFHDGFALSPDGQTLAFTAGDQAGTRRIWTRRLSSLEEQPLRGTEGGSYPFWSPNGSEIGFFADGKLRKVPAAGGQSFEIATVPGLFTVASWGPGDLILFSAYHNRKSAMWKVAASGGAPTELSALGPGGRPTWIDANRFLFVGGPDLKPDQWGLRLASIDGTTSRLIEAVPNFAFAYDGRGHVFLNKNDALVVQTLDAQAGTLGPAVPVAGQAGDVKAWFTVSAAADRLAGFARRTSADRGSPGDPHARLLWVNRAGEQLGLLGPPGRYWTIRLSPDAERAAVSLGSSVLILESGGGTIRLSSSSADDWNPIWSWDGSELFYKSQAGAMRRRPDPTAQATAMENLRGNATDWSRDGTKILTTVGSSSGDIYLYDVATKTESAWLATDAAEADARFSPDQKWIAFASDSGGRFQIYLKPLSGGQTVTVSINGGRHPAWRRDGKEIFFLGEDGSMMAADVVSIGGKLSVSRPRTLFRIPVNDITIDWFTPYDVTADGQRFLLNISDRPEPLLFLQGLDAILSGKK